MSDLSFLIRPIEPRDDPAVEGVIRSCLIEFGAAHEGTAWADPYLGRFSQVYSAPKSRYWVAEDEAGTVVGGTGIGPLPGEDGVCELQKMYLLPRARGLGLGRRLMDTALEFAGLYYSRCYLETLDNMKRAQGFYERCGFTLLSHPLGSTGHYNCQVRYIKTL